MGSSAGFRELWLAKVGFGRTTASRRKEGSLLDTSAWPRKRLKVLDEIHLDSRNVRLETTDAQVEADILEDLFKNEGALGLVEAISKIGYLTHEVPIVVERQNEYVVVEGNRRLAALKAIRNPKLVPDFEARVSTHAKALGKMRSQLASIEVLVAPSQDEADQVVAALHTSNPRRPWSPARQAAFFQAQIDAGRTLKQLVGRYPTIDVKDFVLRARLVNRLKSAVKDDPVLVDFVGSASWKKGFSALTRIFESKDFKEITGAELDSDGKLTTKLSAKQFDQIARLIVVGLHEGDITTRTINKVSSPRFTRLVSDMRAIVTPDSGASVAAGSESKSADASAAGLGSGSAPASGGTTGTRAGSAGAGTQPAESTPKAGKRKRPATTLPTGHLSVPAAYPAAIGVHLEELSLLNIQRTPNATYLLLRVILEKSIKAYALEKKQTIGKKTGKPVQLRECLDWFEGYIKQNGPKPLEAPIKRVQSGQGQHYMISQDALNSLHHNENFSAAAADVVAAWNAFDPLMRELMKP